MDPDSNNNNLKRIGDCTSISEMAQGLLDIINESPEKLSGYNTTPTGENCDNSEEAFGFNIAYSQFDAIKAALTKLSIHNNTPIDEEDLNETLISEPLQTQLATLRAALTKLSMDTNPTTTGQESSDRDEPSTSKAVQVRTVRRKTARKGVLLQRWSSGTQRKMPNDFQFNQNTVIGEVYKLNDCLGVGGFGIVVSAVNLETQKDVAIKIVSKNDDVCRTAVREVEVLSRLRDMDTKGLNLFVKLIGAFDHMEYKCIVMELLRESLRDYIIYRDVRPFAVPQIRLIGYQICVAIKFLHDNHIIHTDIKPDNIAFVKPDFKILLSGRRQLIRTDIKIIDFGNAYFDGEDQDRVITTLWYRAPEVFLGLYWTKSVDTWSLGCTLFEMYNGNPLFHSQTEAHHMAIIEKVIGKIPKDLLEDCEESYVVNGEIEVDALVQNDKNIKPLPKYRRNTSSEHRQLFVLLKDMLQLQDYERISLIKALEHPFFEPLPPEKRCGGKPK